MMAKTKITKRKGSSGSGSGSGPGDQRCTFCPKTFSSKDERNKHLVECAESRLFCEFCHFNTNKLAYLRKHIKKIHCTAESDSQDTNEESEQDNNTDPESENEGQRVHDENNNREELHTDKKTETAPNVISITDSQDDKANENNNENANKNSQSLFDNISSDDDLGLTEESFTEDKDKSCVKSISVSEPPTQPEEKTQTLLEGRVVSIKTRPTPVVSGKRGKCIPLKRRLARRDPLV